MFLKNQNSLFLSLFVMLFIFTACELSTPNKLKGDSKMSKEIQTSSDSSKTKLLKANWRNPVMSPMGVDIARIIRGYFLVGDFQKLLQFVIVPPCYTKKQVLYILRKSTWGYEIKMNNLEWSADSTFILNYRTNKQNTIGAEQYVGRIINDTAKIFLFPEKENLFPYFGDEELNDPCALKNLLDRIYFDFDKTTILPKSTQALTTLLNYLKTNSNLHAHFVGHASNEGNKEHNRVLSENRAKAICDFLAKRGISQLRLSFEGRGDQQPIEENDSEIHKSMNRRVEMVLK